MKYYINVPCGDILAGNFKYIMKAQINIYQQGFLYALQNSISVNWNYAAEMYLHSSPVLSSEMFGNVFQISHFFWMITFHE